MSVSSIENLSNEIIFDIFEYFGACELFHTFSTLNTRFRSLCNSSFIPLKVDNLYSQSERIFLSNYEHVFRNNRNQFLSLHLWQSEKTKAVFSTLLIDTSWSRLESITFTSIDLDLLMSLLPQLASLPRLFALTVEIAMHDDDLSHVYQSFLNLPQLKYLKCYAYESSTNAIIVFLPTETALPISPIECLLMNHPCSCKELLALVSHTPHLRRLKFMNCSDFDTDINAIEPASLVNLTHLSIQSYQLWFDELEVLIRKFSSKLQVLSLSVMHDDMAFLDANRWEKFIRESLPQLEKFYFKYTLQFGENWETPLYSGEVNQFLNPFWLERRWILECETDYESLIYSIRPHKAKWYEASQLSKSIQLEIDSACSDQWSQPVFFKEHIGHVLSVTNIHHLEISANVTLGRVNEILSLLPDVETLQVRGLLFSDPTELSSDDVDVLFLVMRHRLRKLFLRTMDKMADVFFVILIATRVQHLEINCLNYGHVEGMVGLVLNKAKTDPEHSLRSIVCRVATADEEMVDKLGRVIKEQNFLDDFIVSRVMDKICLEWK